MHADRLLLAAEIIEQQHPANVSMSTWGTHNELCGFIACIAGHCSVNRQFNEWGLTSERKTNNYSFLRFSDEIKKHSRIPYCEYHDLAVLFDIPYEDSESLFCSLGINKGKLPFEIAKTLRDYVENNWNVSYDDELPTE